VIVETHLTDVTRLIQLAVAPVFLLTAVGTIIGVLTNRLGRVVDRIRALEEKLPGFSLEQTKATNEELGILNRRMRLVYMAIVSAVFSALFVGLLIASAFIGAFLSVELSALIGILFIAAMLAFIGGLVVFLREIFLAVVSIRRLMG
jgi:hypothetical protein